MWFTFKLTFCIFMSWHFVKWRFLIWRRKRRLAKQPKFIPLTPGQAVERMGANDNAANDLTNHIPTVTPAPAIIANDRTPAPTTPAPTTTHTMTTPAPTPTRRRNNKIINDVTSALINLGMTKRKAKQHVQQCYDNMNNTPTLTELLTYSIKSLSV